MKIKLTLTVEKSIVTSIKQYAQDNGISVSKMVEEFFIDKLKDKSMNNKIDSEIKALMGIIKEKDVDLEEVKSDYFKEKFNL
jgi:DNA polymerase III delta subunit